MSWTVCVSASSTDGALATTDQLRALLGTAASTADDAAQQAAIVRASRWAESYLRYPILAQVYSECVAGFGTPTLMLARTPIRAVLRVFDSTTTEDANVYTSSEYKVDAENGFLILPSGRNFPWTAVTRYQAGAYVPPDSEIKSNYVEYQAGYVWPETSSTGYGTTSTGLTLPADLQYGVLLRAIDIYTKDPDVLSQSIGDLSVTYRSERDDPDGRTPAERALAPYRRGF